MLGRKPAVGSAQIDNGFPTGKPLVGDFLALANTGKEGVRSKAPSNDQSANPVGNVKQSVNALNFWRLLKKNRAVQVVTKHCPPLSLVTSEQVGSSPQFFLPCNELTPVIDEPIATFRQTEKPFREISSETTQPANDNQDPSEPSQQEAA